MAFNERIQILSQTEQSNLYDPPILTPEDQRFFFTLNDQELSVAKKLRNRQRRYMFVLLLGYFKAKPIILNPGYHQIKHDLRYLIENVFPGPGFRPFNLSSRECERLYGRVLALCDYQRWNANHQIDLVDYLTKQSKAWSAPRYLFDEAVEYLSSAKIAIPGYSTLQKIISQVINYLQTRLNENLSNQLSSELRHMLTAIVDSNEEFSLKQLRRVARSFANIELEKEVLIYEHLKSIMCDIDNALGSLCLSPKNQDYFASRVNYYGAKLKRQSAANQQLYLLCYLKIRWQQALERIADGFIHHVRQAKQKAKSFAQESVLRDWKNAANNVGKAAEILHLFIDENIDYDRPFSEVKTKALILLDEKDLESVCLFLNRQKRSVDEATWQYYDEKSGIRIDLLRKLFMCLDFEGSEGVERLAQSLKKLKDDLVQHGTPNSIDRKVIAKKFRGYLEKSDGSICSERYEWFAYLQIPDRMDGRLTLPEAIKYRSLEADLIDSKRWREEKDQLLEQSTLSKLNIEPDDLIVQMNDEFDSQLITASEFLDQEDNSNVVLRSATGKHVWKLPTKYKKPAVNNPFFQQLPKTSVADVLRMVDRDTGFIDCFEHVLGGHNNSRLHEYDLLAILVGNATHQGIYGMSQISDRTYDQLQIIQANYLRFETLQAASDMINNATSKLPIFKHYNIQEGVIHASTDGQKFESRRETFKTRYSSKYFGTQKGVSVMTLIANHLAINARVIGSNEHESHYICDLLMSNSSEIDPDILSTDTHGTNHVNFALLDLSGYSFAPRYRQVGRVINEMFNLNEDDEGKTSLSLKKEINTKRISKHWDTIQRILISLKNRTTTQATLVRKLSGYRRNHPLLEALTEYDRMVKANYLLNYVTDPDLRNHVQRALNRGEAYHQLRRAISNVNGDRFRGNSDEEIQLWNECARLVANAIIYFNSSVLSRLLESFENQNDLDRLEIVLKASPVAWFNINLKGTYHFEFSDQLPDIDELMSEIDGYTPPEKK